ncbi:NAD(P)/FAD-dependent oxidoreductase [Streptomyces sp. NBC_00083]|uniref:NAD(P)/FAD-dependent oxidoreductase n=1 Tax=Streptomyces sp. NBC_00083 TaxID=2975647 RepID=UPI002253FF24|nr:NAD(P)/FAD-dependent oxidoreductase [Streptomyces sp. NBC_00083]MCX5387111.1 NAD(P)/FAD-dependent oxidoreductase [Streptomyces sp. NBC_00083]
MNERTEHAMNSTPGDGRPTTYDVVVIGGGAAGLSGALTLGRARRSVLVVDAGQPRNAPAHGVHAYLGHEGTPPGELLATGRAEVRRYGGEFRAGRATGAERVGDGFRVTLADGERLRARRLLVTTGLVDELPDVPGLAELWGSDVLHCPYCHGWEVRDQAIGVLGTGPLAVHQALLWRQWSADVTLFLHTMDEPDEQQYEELAARGVGVVTGEVAALETRDGRLHGVRLASGELMMRQALAVATKLVPRAGVLAPLGLEPVDLEIAGAVVGAHIAADPFGATEVPGVWVAGNVASPMDQVVAAAAAGVRAGAALNADLVAEETRRAVEARREPFSAQMEREVCEVVLGERRHGL